MKRPCTAPPAPDLADPAYLEDIRSRLGELAQIAHSAPDTSHACLTDEERAARLRFIDRLHGAHDYLLGLSLQTAKEAAWHHPQLSPSTPRH